MRDEGRGRTVVVTGGTGALGRGVVRILLEAGWRVRVPWFSEDEVPRLLEALGGGHEQLELARGDAADPEAIDRFLGEGPVYGLCNLAGGFTMGPLEETEPEAWHRMLRMNATTAFVTSRAAVERMRSDDDGGRVVNVAAFPALERGAEEMSAYAASKSAVVSLTHSLSKELRSDGITVNAVAPEVIDTPANRKAMPDADTSTWLAPEAVGRVIAFLLSDDAGIVTGSVLTLARG